MTVAIMDQQGTLFLIIYCITTFSNKSQRKTVITHQIIGSLRNLMFEKIFGGTKLQ